MKKGFNEDAFMAYLEYIDGGKVYRDYAVASDNTRSVSDVAAAALQNDYDTLTAEEIELLKGFINKEA